MWHFMQAQYDILKISSFFGREMVAWNNTLIMLYLLFIKGSGIADMIFEKFL